MNANFNDGKVSGMIGTFQHPEDDKTSLRVFMLKDGVNYWSAMPIAEAAQALTDYATVKQAEREGKGNV